MGEKIKGRCLLCGFETLECRMTAEESLVGVDDHVVTAASRWFKATCPTHGQFFFLGHVGHHGTVSEKRLGDRFSKRDRLRLREILSPADWKIFDQTYRGDRIPKDGEVEHWRALLGPRE